MEGGKTNSMTMTVLWRSQNEGIVGAPDKCREERKRECVSVRRKAGIKRQLGEVEVVGSAAGG